MKQETLGQQTHTCFQVELLHRVHAAEGPQVDATLKAGGLLQCCNTHTLRQTTPHCYIPSERRRQTAQHSTATNVWTDKDSTAQLCYTLVDRQRQTAQLCYTLVSGGQSTVSSVKARICGIWRSWESEHRHEAGASSVRVHRRVTMLH